MRGPLGPSSVPLVRSRSAQFDELVLDAVDRLQPRWAQRLAQVEFGVEDVPADLTSGAIALGAAIPAIPAASAGPASDARPGQEASVARVVLYRRPIEGRAPTRSLLRLLVNDVVVEQVAALWGVDPGEVDPDYLGDDAG
jgi:predicted Zn-dependent protease with MMP-like domain